MPNRATIPNDTATIPPAVPSTRTSLTPSSSAPQPIDARPILHRTEDNIWVRTSQIRDQLYEAMSQVCAAEGIEALVLKSGPFVHPASVRFEAWMPAGSSTEITERVW